MKIWTCLLLTIILSACVSTRVLDYPQDWPSAQTVVKGQCPDISGIYNNLSEPQADVYSCHGQGVRCASLFDLAESARLRELGAGEGMVIERNGQVSIEQDKNSINFKLQYIDYGGPLRSKETELKEGIDYSCNSEGIVVSDKPELEGLGVPFLGAIGVVEGKAVLIKAVDGSLLANVGGKVSGVVWNIVPVVAYAETDLWWRWKRREMMGFISVWGNVGDPYLNYYIIEPHFVHNDFEARAHQASPWIEKSLNGSEFFEVVQVSLDNKNSAGPLVLRRSSVRIKLPDGTDLYPLDEEEMTKWRADFREKSDDEIYGDWPDGMRQESTDGVFRIYPEKSRDIKFVFRFPPMTGYLNMPANIVGRCTLKYTIETPSGEQVPVSNEFLLNIRLGELQW